MSLTDTVPEKIITDKFQFTRGQYMGKGTFGKCYALTQKGTSKNVAGKCLSKKIIKELNVEHKIMQEVSIHRNLDHRNIVKFFGYTEDNNFIYMLLELCSNRSMAELIKRRKFITSFEAKYYMKQIVHGIQFLHQNNIIHRDLKLGNLLISSTMTVKIADFGLATICAKNQRRHTMCGTPNYIAPEVLSQRGHSSEVDIWATGCILYTLLVGTPPFQTDTKQETYNRILNCEYTVPRIVPKCAAKFISITLIVDPQKRPSIDQLSVSEFLTMGFIPKFLPSTCIILPPRTQSLVEKCDRKIHPFKDEDQRKFNDRQLIEMLVKIKNSLKLIVARSEREIGSDEDAEDPSLRPFIWVNSWADYTADYGFSFRYNDNTVGMRFNDNTSMILLPSGKNGYYIPESDRNWMEIFFNVDQIPEELAKKQKIIESFRNYMFNNLKTAFDNVNNVEQEKLSVLPIMYRFHVTPKVTAMYLTNATFQVNFSTDHVKFIICPLMDAITVSNSDCQIDNHQSDPFRTYQMEIFKTHGCSRMMHKKLKEIIPVIDEVLKGE